MSEPTPPPPEKKPLTWPLIINLGLLLLAAINTGADPGSLASVVFGLVVINGLAALLMHLSGARMHYVLAFILSCLLLLLIGLGICALLVFH